MLARRVRSALGTPLAKASLTSSFVMAAGDAACQAIQRDAAGATSQQCRSDWLRTARFSAVGLTLHGPSFHYSFQLLDRLLGTATTVSTAACKTCVVQMTIFPMYVSAFFWYMGMLEGRGLAGAAEKVQQGFWPTVIPGSLYWPFANMGNFMFVPIRYRVAYVSSMGFAWNSFL
eukprot:evm.model.scf_686.1 EVM.evm.TU.scf_686.1   scf_686:21821-24316(-)